MIADLVKRASLRVERGARTSVVTRAEARSPLALRTPRNHGHAAWVFTSSHGGGLVSGDHALLDVTVADDAALVLATQASTKAYRARGGGTLGEISRLETRVQVGEGALACLLPDPLVPFAGARIAQSVEATLAPSGSVIVWDAITAGRVARGERWAFEHLESRVLVDGPRGRLVTENVRLRPTESRAFALPGFDAFGLLVLLGPRVAALAAGLLDRTSREPARDAGGIFVAHPFARDGFEGALLRVASPDVAALGARLRGWLSELGPLLGDDVLARRAF